MGGAQRYPSTPAYDADGYRRALPILRSGWRSIFPRALAPRCYRWPRQKPARSGFQPLAPDREGTAMRRILAGAIAAVCLSPVALQAEVVRFDIVERGPAFAGRSFGDV